MKKKASKSESAVISQSWQQIFILAALLVWLIPVTYTLFWTNAPSINKYFWIVLANQMILPVLFWVAAFLFVRKSYQNLQMKLFMATFLAWIGMAVYVFFQSLENVLRYRFFPPKIEVGPEEPSLLTMYGHDWLVMGVCVVAFVGTLLLIKHKRKA